jgi:hypothetical protein
VNWLECMTQAVTDWQRTGVRETAHRGVLDIGWYIQLAFGCSLVLVDTTLHCLTRVTVLG